MKCGREPQGKRKSAENQSPRDRELGGINDGSNASRAYRGIEVTLCSGKITGFIYGMDEPRQGVRFLYRREK